MSYEQTIADVSKGVEVAGIAVLIVGGCYALGAFAVRVVHRRSDDAFEDLRRSLGRSILLGLEILVAADIIRTIAITPTFTSVGVLGLIVVVRTFLSFSLEVELDGQWPWRKGRDRQPTRPHRGNNRSDIAMSAEPAIIDARPRAGADLVPTRLARPEDGDAVRETTSA